MYQRRYTYYCAIATIHEPFAIPHFSPAQPTPRVLHPINAFKHTECLIFTRILFICAITAIVKMDSTKFGNIVQYLRDKKYPEGSGKQEKSVLRRFAKKFAFDAESDALYYIDTRQHGSTFKRMVIKEEEKLRVFQECNSPSFAGHVGRDNTIP